MEVEFILVDVLDPILQKQRVEMGHWKMGEVSGNPVRFRFVPSKLKHF